MNALNLAAELATQRAEQAEALLERARERIAKLESDCHALRTDLRACDAELQRERELRSADVAALNMVCTERAAARENAKKHGNELLRITEALDRTAERFGMPVDYDGTALSWLTERIENERDTRASLGRSLVVLRGRAEAVLADKDVLGRQLKANALLAAVRTVTKFAGPYASPEYVTKALVAEAKAACAEVAGE